MKLSYAVTAAALATVLSTTAAEAQTTLYGCYVKNSGTVYRIKVPNTPSKCSGNATEFSWNMEGQPGPVGPQGPQGPAGPSGYKGMVERGVYKTLGPGETLLWASMCQPGEIITGGGYTVAMGATDVQAFTNGPIFINDGPDSQYGWRVHIKNTSANSQNVLAQALCMKL